MSLSKRDLIGLIEFHFSLKGQRLTNLNKVTIEKLNDIVKKHNIDITAVKLQLDEYLIKQNAEQEAKKTQEKIHKALREKQQKINMALYEKQKIRRVNYWRNNPKFHLWVDAMLKINYTEDYEANKKYNARIKKLCDQKEYASKMCNYNYERISDNEIMVNGIIINHGGRLETEPNVQERKEQYDYFIGEGAHNVVACMFNERDNYQGKMLKSVVEYVDDENVIIYKIKNRGWVEY